MLNLFDLLLKEFRMAKKYISDKNYRFYVNTILGVYDNLDDEEFLCRKFKLSMGKQLNLSSPSTFNEKLQWLKLNDRNPMYTLMVDKYKVKKYVADLIGKEYVVPTINSWDSTDEIDFSSLPDRFVLKCNHNSSLGIYICKDKSKMDIDKANKEIRKGLKQNFYLTSREWPYKDVPRKIFAEQYLENSESGGLTDYKIHCFNGIPKFVLVCKDRFSKSGLTEDFFTTKWEHMNVKRPNVPNSSTDISKPEKLDEMLELASKLSKDIPFVRVDFYLVEGRIYFSEMTFYPASGFTPFEPEEWDKTFGDWLVLPNER